MLYTWGYHSSDTQHVHVSKAAGHDVSHAGRGTDLFDVTLYDANVTDPHTGLNCEDQSLADLRELLGYANAAIKAGLEPEPVPDKDD